MTKVNYTAEPVSLVSGSRKTVAFYPVTESAVYGGNAGQRDQTRFNISGPGYIDNTTFHMNFRRRILFNGHTWTGGAPTTHPGILLPQSAESHIDRIEVRIGGVLFDNIQDYAFVESAAHALTQNTDTARSLGAICTGQTLKDVDRVLAITSDGVTSSIVDSTYADVWYSVDLSLVAAFGQNKDYFPLRYASAQQPVQITIYWKPAEHSMTFLPGDPTGATGYVAPSNFRYEISEMFISADELSISEASLIWDDRILYERLVVPVLTCTSYSTTLSENATRLQHSWQHPSEDTRFVLAVFSSDETRALATQATPICTSDMLWFPKGLSRSSLQVGTTRYPSNKENEFIWKQGTTTADIANSGAMNYRAMLTAMGISGNHQNGFLYDGINDYSLNKWINTTGTVGFGGTTGTITENMRTTFMLCWNLDSNPNGPDMPGTGISTMSPAPTTMMLDLTFSEPRGAYDRVTNPMGGSMTVHIYVFTRENYLFGAQNAIRETKLVRPTEQA